jgi:sulfoxide reductase catalytic subunit YedY
MLIKRTRGWDIAEAQATPEHVALNRRAFLFGSGAAAIGLGAGLPLGSSGLALAAASADPSARFYPARRNPKWKLKRLITPEALNTKYNNFYEFGSSKSIYKAAQKLKLRPWAIQIDGLVEKPFDIDFDALIGKVSLEERLYRHRCVEAWSMTVPWTGFPLADLVKLARPLSSAKYLRMETFMMPSIARGQRQSWYPWPYVEGLTMAEATNELAFMVTGAYGKPLPKQMGAPMRLHLPWKYGFKSIKSITRISFTETRPKSFWEALLPREYGFWANVNPRVSHPRWGQSTERVLGTNTRVPTQLYNGYGEWVAHLYKDMKGEKLFM